MNNLKSFIHKFYLDHKTIFATMVERMLAFPCQRLIGKKFAFIADYAIYYNNWARLLVLGIAPFILLGPIPKTFLIQMQNARIYPVNTRRVYPKINYSLSCILIPKFWKKKLFLFICTTNGISDQKGTNQIDLKESQLIIIFCPFEIYLILH